MRRDVEGVYRKRYEDLLARTDESLRRAIALCEEQKARVQAFERSHRTFPDGRRLLGEMSRTIELVRWQRAWIMTWLQDDQIRLLEQQPHPWASRPPADLLTLICSELQQLTAGVQDERGVTRRAVNAALSKALLERGE